MLPGSNPGHNPGQSQNITSNQVDDFPKTFARTLEQGSLPTSMDFHPVHQTLLLGCYCELVLIYLNNFYLGHCLICLSPKLNSISYASWNKCGRRKSLGS